MAWAVAAKDLRLFVRDRMGLFWVLLFPLMFALFFGALFGGGDSDAAGMKVVVVDESNTEDSQAFIERLSASDALDVDVGTDLETASGQVRRGDRVAFVRVLEGYVDGPVGMFGRDDEDGPAIEVGVDPSKTAERGYLQGLVSQAMFSGMTEAFTDGSQMREQADQLRQTIGESADVDDDSKAALEKLADALDDMSGLSNQTAESSSDEPAPALGEGLIGFTDIDRDRAGRPRSSYEISFPSAMVWGLMSCAMAFATRLVRERTEGAMLRLRASPMSRYQMFFGKGLACFVACLGSNAVVLGVGIALLGVRVVNPWLFVLALAATALCVTGIMLMLSNLGSSESSVGTGSWAVMMPMALLGGGAIPLIAMPGWMQTAASASPFKWAILAVEGAVWRDFTLGEMALPIGILSVVGVLLFAGGVALSRRFEA